MHNSPVRTVLVNETTRQELYRIETPNRFVDSVTRVFRCDPAAPPIPDLMQWDAGKQHEGYDSEERELLAGGGKKGGNKDENRVDSVVGVGESPADDPSPVENEVARLYWKWFESTRIVFEGKIRSKAELLPFKSRLKG